MWKQIKEKRMFNSTRGLVPIQVQGLKRDDGFTITHEEQDDLEFGNIEIFLCRGCFGEFKFAASRYLEGEPSAIYEVLLSVSLTSDPKMVRTYGRAIESALLHFPLNDGYNNMPIEKVLFNTKGVLVPAEGV